MTAEFLLGILGRRLQSINEFTMGCKTLPRDAGCFANESYGGISDEACFKLVVEALGDKFARGKATPEQEAIVVLWQRLLEMTVGRSHES